MIRTFRHAGLKAFFLTGSKAGIQPKHAKKLQAQLGLLNQASRPEDLAVPSWRLHPLKGAQAGRWSIWVDENWRLTFEFKGADVELVDYLDYH